MRTRRKPRSRAHYLRGLYAARMRAGLSGVELSRRSGVSSPGISLYEWSERRARPETIIKLARALRVEPGVLVRKPEEKEEE